MEIPKIGPSEGRDVQTSLKPAGQVWKKTKAVSEGILENPTIGEAELDDVEQGITNPQGLKTAKKATSVAYGIFVKTGEAKANP